MGNKPGVTIDGSLIAVPPTTCSRDDAHSYVDRLLEWGRLLDNSEVIVFLSVDTCSALDAEGVYPIRQHLKELFRVHPIVEFTVNDIAQLTVRLLSKSQTFEDLLGIRDVLHDPVLTNPNVLDGIPYPRLKSLLERCLISMAIIEKYCSDWVGVNLLVLRSPSPHPVEIRSRIHEIEHVRNDIGSIPYHPAEFLGCVAVYNGFAALVESVDEYPLMANAKSFLAYSSAMKFAIFKYRIKIGQHPDWDSLEKVIPAIGEDFLDSLHGCCKSSDPRLMERAVRAMMETIHGQNMAAVHQLREGSGGNAKQRTRTKDKAKAQRRDIDYEFHLHYWDCPDGSVELASVVYHNDFSIPE
jgi:hypothetical protein